MAALPTVRIARPGLTSKTTDFAFSFLAPSIQCSKKASYSPVARFSTSPALCKRDNNKIRGLSALRHTGLRKRQSLSVNKYINDLPKPVKPETPLEGDADHGLWGFFQDKKLLSTPVQESRHGRAWTVSELRRRTWPDLHSLWWVCVKERNRLATEKLERKRLQAGYGDEENKVRDETVQETMKAIMETLAERHKAWEEAHRLAALDPSIDLHRTDGPQLVQETYDTEELFDTQDEAEVAGGKESPPKTDGPMKIEKAEPQSMAEKAKAKANKFLWNK